MSAHDAVVALHGGASARRSRGSLAIVGSVAAAMLCIGGFGSAVYGAGPGDSLYGLRSSLFGTQEATRDDQVSLASAQLQQVQQLIDTGQWQQAQDKLVKVSSAVQGLNQIESKKQLVDQWNALTYKVVEQNPAATLPPGQPLPALPSSPLTWLPAPVVEATTTSESTAAPDTTASGSAVTSVTSVPSDSSVPPEVLLTTGPSAPSTSPSPSATTTTTTTTTAARTTATPTTTTTRPTQSPVAVEAPALPASQPKLAPSGPKPDAAASSQPVPPSAPVASSQPKAPPTTTSVPKESDGSSGGATESAAAVTTTTVPPR